MTLTLVFVMRECICSRFRVEIAHLTRGVAADGTPWKLNTEIAEETFSNLSGYKRSANQMTEPRFKWFMLTVCILRNRKTLRHLQGKGASPRNRVLSEGRA